MTKIPFDIPSTSCPYCGKFITLPEKWYLTVSNRYVCPGCSKAFNIKPEDDQEKNPQ